MVESKYAKYIIKESEPDKPAFSYMRTRILCLDNDVIPGALNVNCVWYMKGFDKVLKETHTHDFDEVLAFIGTNPENPYDLGGEIELWLGDEKHMLTKSCLVFLPKGLSHCPLIIKKVDRPIFHFATRGA